MTRHPLDGGEWIELVDRLNHAQMRRIRRAAVDVELDSLTEGVCAMVTGWLVHDVDGREVPFPALAAEGIASDGLDPLPAETVVAMGLIAVKVAGGQPDPKGSDATSSGSPPAPESTSSRSSQTRSSSTITQDGPTATSSPLPPN